MRICNRRTVARLAVLTVAIVGCARDTPTRRTDSATRTDSALPEHSAAAAPIAVLWDTAAGPFFAVAGATPSQAFLVYPAYASQQKLDTLHLDSTSILNMRMDLLVSGDSAVTGRVAAVSSDSAQGCSTWPTLQLLGADHRPVSRLWSVAFPSGRATAVPYDSLPALPRPDSVRLTIAIARAASKAPGDTATAFRGRPYVVRQANRFTLDDGSQVILAEVIRIVNQEANPLQEEMVLILEGNSGRSDTELAIAYSERRVGLEEELESLELTSVLRFRNGTWAMLVRRDIGDGFLYALFERREPQHWVLRWRSAYAGC
jgi:hypothetical protein